MPTYLGRTFSPLLDIYERNIFSRWGGVHVHPVHPPCVRACTATLSTHCCTLKYLRALWQHATVVVGGRLSTCTFIKLIATFNRKACIVVHLGLYNAISAPATLTSFNVDSLVNAAVVSFRNAAHFTNIIQVVSQSETHVRNW